MVAVGYPTSEVAKVLGMSAQQIRGYVADGVVAPERGTRGEFTFSFRDIVLLRAAKRLASSMPSRRVHKALRNLRAQLSDADLSQVQIDADGGHIIVREGDRTWDAESGQAVLDFDGVAEPEVTPYPRPAEVVSLHERAQAKLTAVPEPGADGWYERGTELEPEDPAAAEAAYRRALAVAPDLGHLRHTAGDAAAAADHYRRVLNHTPDDATALFNLGVALEDIGDMPAALAAYRDAAQASPQPADAHYNAAQLCELLGDTAGAIRHWTAYKKSTE